MIMTNAENYDSQKWYKFLLDKHESKDVNMPSAFSWNEQEVASWISGIGYPQYKQTFIKNFINGRKLVLIDASKLSQIGIKDFEHIKIIAAHIRMILNLTEVRSTRCISKPKTELNQEYLLRKSQSGPLSDRYTMEKIQDDHVHDGLWSKTVLINKTSDL